MEVSPNFEDWPAFLTNTQMASRYLWRSSHADLADSMSGTPYGVGKTQSVVLWSPWCECYFSWYWGIISMSVLECRLKLSWYPRWKESWATDLRRYSHFDEKSMNGIGRYLTLRWNSGSSRRMSTSIYSSKFHVTKTLNNPLSLQLKKFCSFL